MRRHLRPMDEILVFAQNYFLCCSISRIFLGEVLSKSVKISDFWTCTSKCHHSCNLFHFLSSSLFVTNPGITVLVPWYSSVGLLTNGMEIVGVFAPFDCLQHKCHSKNFTCAILPFSRVSFTTCTVIRTFGVCTVSIIVTKVSQVLVLKG